MTRICFFKNHGPCDFVCSHAKESSWNAWQFSGHQHQLFWLFIFLFYITI